MFILGFKAVANAWNKRRVPEICDQQSLLFVSFRSSGLCQKFQRLLR